MEGGLTTGFEKTVLDSEMIAMMSYEMSPSGSVSSTPATTTSCGVSQVGPGGHFLGCDHTMKRYRTAFHVPMLSDWRPYESWLDAGAEDAARRANTLWKKMLEAYRQPRMDAGTREALTEFVARREREIGDAAI